VTAIRLLIAEVEGTLLSSDGALTAATRRAVDSLRDADIELAITSAGPPRALRTLIETLGITAPVCGLHGGMLVAPDLSVLEQHVLVDGVARAVIAAMERHGLDVWVWQDDTWLVGRPDATHVAREQATVRFAPDVVDRWNERVHEAVKIAGLGDDLQALARCRADLDAHRAHASLLHSEPRCLIVTHPRANTGELVRTLSRRLGIPPDALAAIGHAPNAVLMFRECDLAIAMGQASAAVQRRARFITRSNDAEGFAYAVRTWVLRMPDEATTPSSRSSNSSA